MRISILGLVLFLALGACDREVVESQKVMGGLLVNLKILENETPQMPAIDFHPELEPLKKEFDLHKNGL